MRERTDGDDRGRDDQQRQPDDFGFASSRVIAVPSPSWRPARAPRGGGRGARSDGACTRNRVAEKRIGGSSVTAVAAGRCVICNVGIGDGRVFTSLIDAQMGQLQTHGRESTSDRIAKLQSLCPSKVVALALLTIPDSSGSADHDGRAGDDSRNTRPTSTSDRTHLVTRCDEQDGRVLRIWHINTAVAASVAPYVYNEPESVVCETVRVPAGRVCSLATFESSRSNTAHVVYGTSDGRFGEVVLRGSGTSSRSLDGDVDEFSMIPVSLSGSAVAGIAVTRLTQLGKMLAGDEDGNVLAHYLDPDDVFAVVACSDGHVALLQRDQIGWNVCDRVDMADPCLGASFSGDAGGIGIIDMSFHPDDDRLLLALLADARGHRRQLVLLKVTASKVSKEKGGIRISEHLSYALDVSRIDLVPDHDVREGEKGACIMLSSAAWIRPRADELEPTFRLFILAGSEAGTVYRISVGAGGENDSTDESLHEVCPARVEATSPALNGGERTCASFAHGRIKEVIDDGTNSGCVLFTIPLSRCEGQTSQERGVDTLSCETFLIGREDRGLVCASIDGDHFRTVWKTSGLGGSVVDAHFIERKGRFKENLAVTCLDGTVRYIDLERETAPESEPRARKMSSLPTCTVAESGESDVLGSCGDASSADSDAATRDESTHCGVVCSGPVDRTIRACDANLRTEPPSLARTDDASAANGPLHECIIIAVQRIVVYNTDGEAIHATIELSDRGEMHIWVGGERNALEIIGIEDCYVVNVQCSQVFPACNSVARMEYAAVALRRGGVTLCTLERGADQKFVLVRCGETAAIYDNLSVHCMQWDEPTNVRGAKVRFPSLAIGFGTAELGFIRQQHRVNGTVFDSLGHRSTRDGTAVINVAWMDSESRHDSVVALTTAASSIEIWLVSCHDVDQAKESTVRCTISPLAHLQCFQGFGLITALCASRGPSVGELIIGLDSGAVFVVRIDGFVYDAQTWRDDCSEGGERAGKGCNGFFDSSCADALPENLRVSRQSPFPFSSGHARDGVAMEKTSTTGHVRTAQLARQSLRAATTLILDASCSDEGLLDALDKIVDEQVSALDDGWWQVPRAQSAIIHASYFLNAKRRGRTASRAISQLLDSALADVHKSAESLRQFGEGANFDSLQIALLYACVSRRVESNDEDPQSSNTFMLLLALIKSGHLSAAVRLAGLRHPSRHPNDRVTCLNIMSSIFSERARWDYGALKPLAVGVPEFCVTALEEGVRRISSRWHGSGSRTYDRRRMMSMRPPRAERRSNNCLGIEEGLWEEMRSLECVKKKRDRRPPPSSQKQGLAIA